MKSEYEILIALEHLRKDIGDRNQLTGEQIRGMIYKMYPPVEETFLEKIKDNEVELKSPNLSRVQNVVNYLSNQVESTLTLLQYDSFKENRLHDFIFWDDLLKGFKAITTVVKVTEAMSQTKDVPTESADSEAIEIVRNLSERSLSPEEEKNMRLSIERSTEAANFFLKTDPSGFSLVDYVVMIVETEDWEQKQSQIKMSAPRIPEFVFLGAYLAQKLYKEVYPLT